MRQPSAATATIAFVLLVSHAACGGSPEGTGPDAGPGDTPDAPAGECAASSDCEAGKVCAAGTCVIGGCGQASLELEYVAPNLLFVLDRSCSMRAAPSGSTLSKWAVAVGGINQVITDHGDDIRYGLTLFPDLIGGNCTQESFAFPTASGNGAGIQTLLTSALGLSDPYYPDGPCVTNIDTGLQQAATDPALADPARASYLMLVTDGAQSSGCSAAGADAGSEAIVLDLFGNRGIPTFVIGFGSAVDAQQLNKLAIAGGTALTGTAKYYKAETAGQLDQALATIADIVVSCDYKIDPPPPVLAQTYVWFEKTAKVPRDTSHADGWDFDTATNTLTFYGSYCTQLKTRAVDTVDVVYDCDGPLL
jgi:hypothetical protein